LNFFRLGDPKVCDLRTFKYMMLREGVCSNRQNTVIRGEEVWQNRHITFIVAKKSLIYSLFCSIYGVLRGGGWLKTSYGGRGLAENVKNTSYREGGLKLLKKTVII